MKLIKIFIKDIPKGDNIVYVIILISLGLAFKGTKQGVVWWSQAMSNYQEKIFANFCIFLGIIVFCKFIINFKLWIFKVKLKYSQFVYLYLLFSYWLILIIYYMYNNIFIIPASIDFIFNISFIIFPVCIFFVASKLNRMVKYHKYYK